MEAVVAEASGETVTTIEATDARVARLDELSLNQALIDFEVANARVLDLTRRLTSLNEELRHSRTHAEQLRIALDHVPVENTELRGQLDSIRSSTAFRIVRVAGTIARRVRAR